MSTDKEIPRTMTPEGLKFIEKLAGQKSDGVYLEIGPLFGSSTDAIDRGRTDGSTPIHTIDTFEDAPWVQKATGLSLSRKSFEEFTSHIDNLVIHEGFAPDVVRSSWKDDIGFYFDDGTHGNPNWMDNFKFFSPFFSDNAIICGDDFASGWPDIIKNVYSIAKQWDTRLFVVGRVWALCKDAPDRIEAAVDQMAPGLKDVTITARNGKTKQTSKAAVWTAGIHRKQPLDSFEIVGPKDFTGHIVTMKGGELLAATPFNAGPVSLKGADRIMLTSSTKLNLQFCTADQRGVTANTKYFPSGTFYWLPEGSSVVAVRLMT